MSHSHDAISGHRQKRSATYDVIIRRGFVFDGYRVLAGPRVYITKALSSRLAQLKGHADLARSTDAVGRGNGPRWFGER